MVAGFGKFHTSLILVNVPQMPNRVSQPERIALCAVELGSFLIVLSRRIAATQIPLDLPQARERLGQFNSDVSLTTEVDSLDQVPSGIVQPILSSRLKSLPQEFVGCI